MFVRAYFAYDSKKSGGVTMSYLRFGKKGDTIVKMNIEAVDKTIDNLVQIQYPASWAWTLKQPETDGRTVVHAR